MNHYIIDGNNLIGKISELKKLQITNKQESRERLVDILNTYFSKKKIKISLHFDGYENTPLRILHGKIYYSNKLQADNLIRKEIDNSQSKRLIILVTSDLSLAEYGKVNGCKVISSDEFYKEIKKSEQINEEEERINQIKRMKDEFLKLFGE